MVLLVYTVLFFFQLKMLAARTEIANPVRRRERRRPTVLDADFEARRQL